MASVDAVLLIAFGGPETPEDVWPFLERVTAGRRIPTERLRDVAHHYEAIGGRSPLNELTRRQAEGLRRALAGDGRSLPVFIGLRNARPYLDETLGEMRDRGCRRVLGIILSSFQTEASWDRYVADVTAARDRLGPGTPEVVYAPPWGDHALFIRCMRERVVDGLDSVPAERRAAAHVVFTAHSVPVSMAEGSPYAAGFETAARTIASGLGRSGWSIAYQSRSGSTREPWLEPDVADVLRTLAGHGVRDVVVAPIGFVSDHVEVLYDLDVEARGIAHQLGLGFVRALAANDHPTFVAMLADLVRRATAPVGAAT
jgi:ferrochelatase